MITSLNVAQPKLGLKIGRYGSQWSLQDAFQLDKQGAVDSLALKTILPVTCAV